ncbi:hypothetical protein [Massilia agri]
MSLSLAGAYWLGKSLIQHRLAQDLEKRKAELAQQLENQKSMAAQDLEQLKKKLELDHAQALGTIDADVRRNLELDLGQVNAQREYEYEARRRLYAAIGPLRFQLLLSCRDLIGRIEAIGSRERYKLDLSSYYARSTIYRILKPFALASLIEEQIALSDFSVDEKAIDLIRFRRSVTRIFSGDEFVARHPNVNWLTQEEHIFADRLSASVQPMIRRDSSNARVMRFEEFNSLINSQGWHDLAPIDHIFCEFEASSKPILWARLVAYAYLCNSLINSQGSALGFELETLNVEPLLSRANDLFISENISQIISEFVKMENKRL